MKAHASNLKKYIDGTLIVMSGLAWHGVITTGTTELIYPLVITGVSLAVILGLRAKEERLPQITQ